MHPVISARLFSRLRRCFRESDFIGWYRAPCVAGAVLTELGNGTLTDVAGLLAQRVTRLLRDDFPAGIARRLDVRVHSALADTMRSLVQPDGSEWSRHFSGALPC